MKGCRSDNPPLRDELYFRSNCAHDELVQAKVPDQPDADGESLAGVAQDHVLIEANAKATAGGRTSPRPGLSAHQERRYCRRMSVTAEKVAEVLALPEQDRAYLARQLIASLNDTVDADAETQWNEVIDRRSREIEEGKVTCRPVAEAVKDIRTRLHARRQPS